MFSKGSVSAVGAFSKKDFCNYGKLYEMSIFVYTVNMNVI